MWGQMTRDLLAEQKAMIQQAINEDIANRRQLAGFPQSENEQKETSMLKGHEASESLRIYKELQQKYQETINKKGGIEAVIKELEDYIIALLGNDKALRTDPQMRKYNPRDPLLVQQQKAALRALIDEAPGSNFGNFLDPSATGHIGLQFAQGQPNGREVLAYFWLAASDPLMQLDEADKINREQCIREEKMMVIAQLCDIRRAHNDGQYSAVDDEKDDPSCGPGTWGRIAKMHVHNQLTKMRTIESPADKFKQHMTPFFIEKFTALDLTSQLELINSMSDYLINQEKYPLNAPVTTLDNFIIDLRLSEADEMQYFLKMIEEYGEVHPATNQKMLDENHQRFAVVTYHEELLNIKDLINNDLFIRLQGIMINRLIGPANDVVKKKLKEQPQVKAAHQKLIQIESEIRKLQVSLLEIQSKIKQPDVNALKAQKEVDELKEQKLRLENTFLNLTMEKAAYQKIITEIAKSELSSEVAKTILEKMTVPISQVEEFTSKLVVHINRTVEKKTEQVAQYPLSKEIASISVAQIKSSPNYAFLLKAMNEQKALERMVKNVILSQNSDLSPERISELVKEWMDYQDLHLESHEPTFVKTASVPLSKTKNPFDGLSEQDKYALGLQFYNKAKTITDKTAAKKIEYEYNVKNAIDLGVRCELAINSVAVKEQGIDQANINPTWLIRLNADLEDAEERFILNDAILGQTFVELRQESMINAFNAFINQDKLAKINRKVMKLNSALDSYFDEISKETPNQQLLVDAYLVMQQAQKEAFHGLDAVVEAFGKHWVSKEKLFFAADKEYLLSIITDSNKMQQKILPEIQAELKKFNEKLAQLDLLSSSHTYFQDTMSRIKQDILKLVSDFEKSMADCEVALQASNPKKGTIAFKQLQAIQRVKAKLLIDKNAFNEKLQAHHLIGVDLTQFYKFAESAVATANSLQTELGDVGASAIHKSIRALKNGAKTVIGKPVRKNKELSKEQIQGIKVSLDTEEIRKQKQNIEEVKTLVKRYDHKRQPAIMKSFEETRRLAQTIPQITNEQSKLALDYIQLNASKPENVNLEGYLKEGVIVSIVDRNKSPLQLQFEDPSSSKPPKRVTVEVAVLKDYADRLRRKIEQRERAKDTLYESFGILFRDGAELGVLERNNYVDKLKEIGDINQELLTLALASQTREGLHALSQTLQADLLAKVISEVSKKAADYNQLEKSALDSGKPIPNRHEWERTTAKANQAQLSEALMQKLQISGTRKRL